MPLTPLMSSSSEEQDNEDFIPLGISMLNLGSNKKPTSVMAQKIKEDSSGLPPSLQYFNLLNKAMEILNRTREEESERLKLRLSVVRKNRRTYVNIVEVANRLNRQPEHLMHFIAKSLYTDGSINKEGQLVLTGSYLQSAIEKVLRQFIELYVVCKSCENVEETYIVKENKLYFLKCDKCKGSRCVGNVIDGFTFKGTPQAKLRGLI